MTTTTIGTGVSSYAVEGPYDTAWSGTAVSLAPGHGGQTRYYTIGSALNAIHDGCTVDDIKIEFVASKGSAFGPVTAYATFAGITLSVPSVSASSTAYSANGGAGTLPSVVRAGVMSSSCLSEETFYTMAVNMSLPTITVTYTDNGIPYMMQFSL